MAITTALGRLFGGKASASPPGLPAPIQTPISILSVDDIFGMTEAEMYRTQPYLRTVISFLARNIAQLGIQNFARVTDTNRSRVTDSPAAKLFTKPNPATTNFELIYGLVSDLALFDRAYWFVTRDTQSASGWRITPIPAPWVVGQTITNLFEPATFIIQPAVDMVTERVELPASQFVYFHGWNARDPKIGTTPIHALKELLAEQVSAQKYRNQVWANGGRVSGTINRPNDAPPWSDQARRRFLAGWRDRHTGDVLTAGGTALLEDGMTYTQTGFSAKENEFVDVAKLALGVVCSVYHINPTMVGQTEQSNYSNVKEFRKMLYGDTLGPIVAQLEARINGMLLPMIGEPDTNYVEFNINEKLQGNFEDQALSLQMAVGGPWMAVNEARAINNMSGLGPEYDEVITPLNVVRGGGTQASPTDSAPAPADRTGPGDSQPEQQPKSGDAESADLDRFIRRQGSAVISRLGAGQTVDEAWDDDRWNKELATLVPAETAIRVNAARKEELRAAVASGGSSRSVQTALAWSADELLAKGSSC